MSIGPKTRATFTNPDGCAKDIKAWMAAYAMGYTSARDEVGFLYWFEPGSDVPIGGFDWSPDIDDTRFCWEMLRWLEGHGLLNDTLIGANVDWLEPISEWPDLLADAVIAKGGDA